MIVHEGLKALASNGLQGNVNDRVFFFIDKSSLVTGQGVQFLSLQYILCRSHTCFNWITAMFLLGMPSSI